MQKNEFLVDFNGKSYWSKDAKQNVANNNS